MGFRKTIVVVALLICICSAVQGGDTKPKDLPSGIVKALAGDEKEYCNQFSGAFKKGCKESFRANLLWHELEITPHGLTAILVENHNMGACGSAGCALYLFVQQSGAKFVQVLGKAGDIGALDGVKVLETVTAGYYDIQRTWRDGRTRSIYKWDGQKYSALPL